MVAVSGAALEGRWLAEVYLGAAFALAATGDPVVSPEATATVPATLDESLSLDKFALEDAYSAVGDRKSVE